MPSRSYELFERILKQYDTQGLKELCARLGVVYDDLEGESRRGKALALSQHMDMRLRLDELEAAINADAEAAQAPRPAQSQPQPAGGSMNLTTPQRRQLEEALRACSVMQDADKRDLIVSDLREEIRSRIERHGKEIADVSSIVRTCLSFQGGLAELIEAVRYYEGPTDAMKGVDQFMATLGTAAPATSAAGQPATAQQPAQTQAVVETPAAAPSDAAPTSAPSTATPVATPGEASSSPLSNSEQGKLMDAILSAFPLEEDLKRALYFRLNYNYDLDAQGSTYRNRVFNLVRVAVAGGWDDKLLVAARQAVPGNKALEAFAAGRDLSSIEAGTESGLERVLKQEAGFIDFAEWMANWGRLEPKVCRVEIPLNGNVDATVCRQGMSCGTGFLVGPDLLLTNYHVVEFLVEPAIRRKQDLDWADPAHVRLRFDYAKRPGGAAVSEGVVFRLADEWLVAHARYSKADRAGAAPDALPAADELDFALVRVAGSPGEQPVGGAGGPGAAKRGYVRLPAAPAVPAIGRTVFIMQHPEGRPLQLAFGRIVGPNGNGTRLRYNVDTEPGSSGSPCFDGNLEPVALHHCCDKKRGLPYNQSIPLALIVPKIRPYLPG